MKRIKLPAHLAIIMDGNGKMGLGAASARAPYGHKMGVQNMFKVCTHAFRLGVRIVTVFALSTENLYRPKAEVEELFRLFASIFRAQRADAEMNVKINVIGDITVFPEDIRAAILQMMKRPKTARRPVQHLPQLRRPARRSCGRSIWRCRRGGM